MLGAENGNVPGTLTYGKLYFPGGVKHGCTLASVGWMGNELKRMWDENRNGSAKSEYTGVLEEGQNGWKKRRTRE